MVFCSMSEISDNAKKEHTQRGTYQNFYLKLHNFGYVFPPSGFLRIEMQKGSFGRLSVHRQKATRKWSPKNETP